MANKLVHTTNSNNFRQQSRPTIEWFESTGCNHPCAKILIISSSISHYGRFKSRHLIACSTVSKFGSIRCGSGGLIFMKNDQ